MLPSLYFGVTGQYSGPVPSNLQRIRKQYTILLSQLMKTGELKSGSIKHPRLKRIYNEEVKTELDPFPYYFIFLRLLKDGYIFRKQAETPEVVRFDMQQVERIVQASFIESFSKLKISADIDNLATEITLKPQTNKKIGEASPKQAKPLESFNPQPSLSCGLTFKAPAATVTSFCRLSAVSSQPSTKQAPSFVKPSAGPSIPKACLRAAPNKSSESYANSPSMGTSSISKSKPSTENNDNSKSSSGSKKDHGLFVDQHYSFKLGEISKQDKKAASPGQADVMSCAVCGERFEQEEQLVEHKQTDEHCFRDLYQSSRRLLQSEKTKPPKAVSGEVEGIVIQSADGMEGNAVLNISLFLSEQNQLMGKTVSTNVQLMVNYKPPKISTKPLYLDRTFFILGSPEISLLEDKAPRQTVRTGKQIKRNFKIIGKEIGSKDYIVVFKFMEHFIDFDKAYFVMKKICVRVDNDATKEDGLPVLTNPTIKAEPEFPQNFITVMPEIIEEAEPPPKPQRQLFYIRRLGNYDLPINYSRLFNFGFENNANITPLMMRQKYEILNVLVDGLNEDNYDHFFSLLLYLEEHQTLCDLRTYSMKDTPLLRDKQSHKLISITVPGLSENRPSVLKSDAIYITLQGSGTFKGYVHQVGSTTVHVGMGARFMKLFVDKMKATVDFSFSRMCVRMEHRALEIIKQSRIIPKVCFPKTFGAYAKEKPIKSWINRLVMQNPEQRQAVQNIINGTSLPAPYLLFGPPGTGKTVTLVETIKQIFFQSDLTRILATAPSNSAADLLAERVLESVPASQVLRLYSPSRNWSLVPASLQRSSNFYGGECNFPSLMELKKYRVMIATLICTGRLVSGGFPEGHFTHIFVDECGHGMEPTALVPVAGLLSSEPCPGQLVLSGDPRQLGPVIRSPIAKSLGLSLSMLERLMSSCALYQKQEGGGYNPQVLTKLVKNFRSHPDILKVPNELFYEGDLEPCGEVGVTHSACQWEELPTKGVPLIFHGVEGKDAQDDCSPSFYNIAEVDLVVTYVQKVLDGKFCGQKLKPSDIGIISPYRRQITKLHRALERKKLVGLSVGSVEEFQGQERRVIIITTVRSDPAQLALDRKFRLGFLREPKRFNVAVTRAKALLIVIGNPYILQTDPNWRRLLEWSIQQGGYKGCRFSLSQTQSCAATVPSDPGQQRLQVQKKLEQQLRLTKDALKLHTGNDNNWNTNALDHVGKIMDQIKKLSFLSEVSELEKKVSPPFSAQEQ